MELPLYLLVLAAFLGFLNLKTYTNKVTKRLTYWGMWVAIITSVVLVIKDQL